MRNQRMRTLLFTVLTALTLAVFFCISNFLAPLAAMHNTLNPYYLLNMGAPALFHEDVDAVGAIFKLEPWRLLGMQMPAFAGIKPGDWQETVRPPVLEPTEPVTKTNLGRVVIYHTHTSEAFVPSNGDARSLDPAQTVVRLGEAMEAILSQKGIAVTQVKKFHDQPYHKSYAESRKTALDLIASLPDTQLLIDVHRDGVGKTAAIGREITTATIGDKKAGQIMFVLSSAHENWQKNNRIANDLHNLLEDKYPGLSRGILIRLNSTYNQDLHPGALLVEIGGHWNTLAEAVYGAELFAQVLAEYCGGAP